MRRIWDVDRSSGWDRYSCRLAAVFDGVAVMESTQVPTGGLMEMRFFCGGVNSHVMFVYSTL
jgi:hypothetical protein